jgi:hypothetical protein
MGALAKPAMQIGAAIGGHFLGKKSQSAAMKRSPEEMEALQGSQAAGKSLQTTGTELVSEGRQTLQQPTGYWQRLLGGNRPLMAQATAAPRAALTDIYRGAERNLEKSGVRGAARDVAQAELGRQRASQVAGLTTGVQPFAAQQLTGIGSEQLGTGAPMLAQAGDIFTNLLGQGAGNRRYAREEGEKAGTAAGGLIFDVMSGVGGMKRGGGGGVKPSPFPGAGSGEYY